MPTFAVSALLAVLGGVVVIVVGFVPYVAWSYRRRGVFGFGHAFLAGCTAVYALALWTYTILPLPDPATICRRVPAPQLRPFQFVADIGEAMATGGPVRAVVAQVVLNVVLFVPLGMLARHLFRRGFVVTVLLGLGTSLLIEVTQLTGNWGLYPCAYRLFDVDDLIANTGGAALGFLAAPVLRLVPGQRTLDVRLPRPVTTGRAAGHGPGRQPGAAVRVAGLASAGFLLLASGALDSVRISEAAGWVPPSLSLLFGVVLLVGVPLLGHGATPASGWCCCVRRPRTAPRRRSVGGCCGRRPARVATCCCRA
ncbi:MAG: VanZ family protein [Micropruina sp.]